MLRKLALAAGVLLGSVTSSLAVDTPHWKDVGNWTLRVDPTYANGCFMLGSWERGTIVRIGFDQKRELYWLLGNSDWRSIVPGRDYSIRVVFDGMQPFNGAMRGVRMGDSTLLQIQVSKEFLAGFMRSGIMEIYYNGQRISGVRLTGSMAAGVEMISCQRSLDGTGGDPFASSGYRSSSGDPFR